MIGSLTGILKESAFTEMLIDVNGVGYLVFIPLSTYDKLPRVGEKAGVLIYTHVKEDAISLFGFRTPAEKNFFQLLISVSGIGPKMGKDILSNIQVEDLGQAIVRGDLARLSAIPGIGRKTAERLVLELKEKVLKLDVSPPAKEGGGPVISPDLKDDVASALVNLGYKDAVVNKTLAGMKIPPDASMETVLKQALKLLMK